MTTACPTVRRAGLRARWHASAGITLVELLVAMVVAGLTATIALSVLVSTGLLVTRSMATTTTLSQLEDASGLLLRDVNDGRKIVVAEPDALTVQVTRDSVCTQRAWTIEDGDLVVTTDTYSTERCTGGSETARMEVVQDTLTGVAFHYFSALSQTNEMPQPVSLNDVTRVTWDLSAQPAYPDTREVEISSGAAFTGRGASSDGTGQVQDATRPVLQVTTPRVGVDKPVLEWTDTSPELTAGWTVFRIANPEGTGTGTATTWTAVMRLGPGMLSWTDTTLPAGYSAQYTVQATLTDDRQGPTSNQVSTGLRPSAPVTTATGRQAGIDLSWTRTDGADAWDLYRDGALYRNWSQLKADAVLAADAVTWTDATGVAHAHDYRVVAINRWERAATDPAGAGSASAQRNVVPAGTAVTADLGEAGLRATRLASTANAAAGAFTAAARPAIASTETASTSWQNTVTWTPAGWTGSGPMTKGGVHRDRGWETQQRATTSAAWANLWAGAAEQVGAAASRTATATYSEASIAGQYRYYQIRTCNAVGCSTWSSQGSSLQRPPTPTCTATATSTRSAHVDVSRPSVPSSYTNTEVVGGTAAPGYGVAGTGQRNSSSWDIDQLRHSTGQNFTTRNANASKANGGWSNQTSCVTSTPVLAAPSISVTGVTTRGANAAATAPTPGSWVESVSIGGGGASRNDLDHGTEYRVDASVTDGVNHVAGSTPFRTLTLTVGAPACAISGGGTAPNGTATLTASGGAGATGYEYTPGRVRTGLSAGTYSGSCRSVRTDGHNTVRSGWVSGASVTVAPNPYPSAWGDRVGCPGVGIYITPTSPTTFNVRRLDAVNCQARHVVTQAGFDADPTGPAVGSVVGMYTTTVTGSLWTRVSGSGPATAPAV
ncbi:MAG TPA: prepilin-type N-terminal cleavage/methylation domain-containing protein [Cellulomonas sp.]